MFLKTIELTNLLSFGHMRLEIEPLNVLNGQ